MATEKQPYTPKTLAARWGCKPGAIYGMIRRGELESFTVGPKLIRIPYQAVERIECKNIKCSGFEGGGPSSIPPTPQQGVAATS